MSLVQHLVELRKRLNAILSTDDETAGDRS